VVATSNAPSSLGISTTTPSALWSKRSCTLLGKAQILACTDFYGVFSDAAVGPKAGLLRHFQGCGARRRIEMVDGAEREAGTFLKALDQRVEERLANLESVMTGTTRTETEDPWNI
jgi:hypothetical protein